MNLICIFFFFRKKFPEVSQHMNDLEMPWALIATKWFICLFSEVLPIEVLKIEFYIFYYNTMKFIKI